MLKEFIFKIEDKGSPDLGKTFKVKQPPVLEFEKLMVKFAGCFSTSSEKKEKTITINEDKTIELLNEILKYCYYIQNDVETQLINERANAIIEDPMTLLLLKKEFIKTNPAFMKVVDFMKQEMGGAKNTTTTKE